MRRLSSSLCPILLPAVIALGVPALAEPRITRIEIVRVEKPTFRGTSFGAVGQYEKLVGHAFGEVDPSAARNPVIAGIRLAPRISTS